MCVIIIIILLQCTVSKDAVVLSAQPKDITSMVREITTSNVIPKVSCYNIFRIDKYLIVK